MTHADITAEQRMAARVIGFAYLFAMILALFTETFVRGKLLDFNSASVTAQNLLAHERLFRAGIACEILTFASDITLIAALFTVLAPASRFLALVATGFRLVAAAVCVVMTLGNFDVLRAIGGAEYLAAFNAAQLQGLMRFHLGAHGAAYNVAFVFLGAGSAVFAVLWRRSRYIPAALAWLGVAASALLAAGSLVLVVYPDVRGAIYPAYMLPMFVFEVSMGSLLLLRGLPRARPG